MLSFLKDLVPGQAPSPVKIIVIGAGQRGSMYASEIRRRCPTTATVVGVCEPNPVRLREFQAEFSVPAAGVFDDWKALVKLPKMADAVLICVQDALHAEVAIECARLQYHIMLEKPMAVSIADCLSISQAVRSSGVMLAVGHVLRYAPVNVQIKQIVQSGVLGQVCNIQHLEPVGYYHFAHSYVRGNWSHEQQSTFSLMAKSCHDIDLLTYFMEGDECLRVSSFGSLTHFKKAKKPKEAADATRCLDCKFEASCPYSAKKIYLDEVKAGNKGWPVSVVSDIVGKC